MGLYRIQMFKTLTGDRFWTNVYHTNATTLDAAADLAFDTIMPFEAAPMDGSFKVVKILVSNMAGDDFRSIPTNVAGGASGSPYLPLFNTIKVNFLVAGDGRNDYKFYRGILSEANQTNGQVDSGLVTSLSVAVNTLIADASAGGTDLVDSEGNLWVSGEVQVAVQMRQLHRRRRRVVTP